MKKKFKIKKSERIYFIFGIIFLIGGILTYFNGFNTLGTPNLLPTLKILIGMFVMIPAGIAMLIATVKKR